MWPFTRQPKEPRSIENPATPLSDPSAWLVDLFSGGASEAGKKVTPRSSLGLSTVFACVLVISDTIALLPLQVMRRVSERSEVPDRDHHLWPVLHDAPGGEQMTSFTWRSMGQSHALLWGASFSFISRTGGARTARLIPLSADRTWAVRERGVLRFEHMTDEGSMMRFDPMEIVHVPGFTLDGINGASVIGMQRETIGAGVASRDFSSKIMDNGFITGVIEYPGQFKDAQVRDKLLESWKKAYAGLDNAGKTAVLEKGMTFKEIGMPAADAQHIENRKYNRQEIAAMFRVPIHLLQDLEHSAVRANIEQQDTNFAKHTILPWVVRWEQALNYKLLSPEERLTHVIRFNLEGLMRGDSKARSEFYESGIQNGWMTRNEPREKENLPITDDRLDEFLMPVNMVAVGEGASGPSPDPDDPDPDDDDDDDDDDQRSIAVQPLVDALVLRLRTREHKALDRFVQRHPDDAEAVADDLDAFFDQQRSYIAQHLQPIVLASGQDLSVDVAADRYVADFAEQTSDVPLVDLPTFAKTREIQLWQTD